jgi:NADH-quinone oxidoreductase subunit G
MADVNLTIDGIPLTVPAGTLLVEAAKLVQTDVPVYCYHPKLGPAGLCRICLVEVEKMPKLQIACNTVATEGMVVHTQSSKANDGRRSVLEFLLLNHPLDCPICDKGGECDLQDFAMAYGRGYSRLADPKLRKPKAVDLGPTIVLDEERCIVCQRCTRFDDIITHERSLVVKDRGHNDIIATASGEPYRSDFSGNVTELCPVGALTSKTYRFKSRPWDLHRTQTTCQQCSTGCAQNVDVRHGEILRTMAIEEDAASDGWLCDRGRYNVGFYGDARRLTAPMLRDGDGWSEIDWDDAIALWAKQIAAALAAGGPASIGAIGGGRLLNEEAYLLQHLFRALGVQNLDWRAGRQFEATPGSYAGTHADLEAAQAVILIGRPPSQTAPVLDLRIRKAVMHRGARLVAVGPFAAASFVPALRVDEVAEIPPEFFAAERIAVVYDGIETARFRALTERLAPLGADKSISVFIPGEQPNARGAEAMGMLPRDGGLHSHAMFSAAAGGSLAVLSLFGVNPVLQLANGPLARRALETVPFSVVSELFMTETARLATLVLPALGAFERSGHACDLTGAVRAVATAIEPLPGALSDGQILTALAAELGVAIPSPAEIEALAQAPGSPADRSVPAPGVAGVDGKAPALGVAFATNIFSGGGTALHDERIAALRPAASIVLGPRTAAALEVRSGDRVDVVSGGDVVVAGVEARIDPEVAEDTLIAIDGVAGAQSNAIAPGTEIAVANIRTPLREGALA